jgi:hypothetical protein
MKNKRDPLQLRIATVLWILIVTLLISGHIVEATYFNPAYYWSHQRVEYANEWIRVGNDASQVEFTGVIIVNSTRDQRLEWVTFEFAPTSLNFEKVENYSAAVLTYRLNNDDEIAAQPSYTVEMKGDKYVYNVSLPQNIEWPRIQFTANYTIRGSTTKLRDSVYSYHRYSIVPVESMYVAYSFPFTTNFLHYPPGSELDNGRQYHTLKYQEKGNTYTNIEYEDIEERVFLDKKEKQREFTINILLSIAFTILGTLLGYFLVPTYKKSQKSRYEIGHIKHYKKYDKIEIKIQKR